LSVERSPSPAKRPPRPAKAFTLVEVLATILLLAIVLPVVDRGIASATGAGSTARYRTEAAQLAESKLSELIATGSWNTGNRSGDFGSDWPGYRWDAEVSNWANDTQGVGLQQLDVTVYWTARGRNESLMISSLVYVRPVPSS
jgi:prepilin-type N-terminal cleavage/methylation domain-containing protein